MFVGVLITKTKDARKSKVKACTRNTSIASMGVEVGVDVCAIYICTRSRRRIFRACVGHCISHAKIRHTCARSFGSTYAEAEYNVYFYLCQTLNRPGCNHH